ncbi:MAG: hypothetical protein ABFS30_11025 [Pseudomonadota bacterium]
MYFGVSKSHNLPLDIVLTVSSLTEKHDATKNGPIIAMAEKTRLVHR